VPELDTPSDPTTPSAVPPADPVAAPPGISRRQALAMGGGLAAAAAVMGAGPASAQEASPTASPTAGPTTPPPATPAGIAGEPQTLLSISLEQAQRVLAAAEAHAAEIGVAMNIVIIDVCGDVKASSRQDGNGRASLVLAPLKAQTALAFRTATAVLGANTPPERVQTFLAAGFTVLGGGLPILDAETKAVIGAIGVGGGSPEQDVEVAEAGLAGAADAPS